MKYLKLYENFNLDKLKENLFLCVNQSNMSIKDINLKMELIDNIKYDDDNLTYNLYRMENGKYVIGFISSNIAYNNYNVQPDEIVCRLDSDSNMVTFHHNVALKQFLKKLQSYKLQKEWIEKYPERLSELREFGFNDKIKKEFPALVRGTERGFFDLERSSK